MIICLNNFPIPNIFYVETLSKYGKIRKIIYVNNYQCLIINKVDILMNQQGI